MNAIREIGNKSMKDYEKRKAELKLERKSIEEKISKLQNELQKQSLSDSERAKIRSEIGELEKRIKEINDKMHNLLMNRIKELQEQYLEESRRKELERLEKTTVRGVSLFKQAVCDFCSNAKYCDAYSNLDPQKMLPCILSELLIAIGPKEPGFRL